MMDKSRLILIIPASIVFVMIIAHSYRAHGFRTTRNFFFWCMFFCYMKEFINAHSRAPEYMGSGLEVFGVPMMVPVGWVISIYLSWFLAESLLLGSKLEGSILPTIAMSSVAITAISLCVACSGGNAGWWRWNYCIPSLWHENPILKMPVKIIGGWATTNLIFMSFFMLFEFSRFGRLKKKAAIILLVLIFLGSTVGLMATNLALRHKVVAPLVVGTILLFIFIPRIRAKNKASSRTVKKSSVIDSAVRLRGAGAGATKNNTNR